MVRIDVTYEGGLRARAVHAPSGTTLITDAPVDNHGKGESFSPTDLVATAAASCLLTIMGIAADERGWSIEGATARVEKHMTAKPTRRIERLELVVRVPGSFGAEQRALLERAAQGCPVNETLRGKVEFDLRFEWPASAQG